MAIEIVSFPLKMVDLSIVMLVYQRVDDQPSILFLGGIGDPIQFIGPSPGSASKTRSPVVPNASPG